MSPAEGSPSPTVEGRLAALHRERATGALTVRDGPRLRTFFLRDGRLVQTASNLKKEGAEVVAGRMAETSLIPQVQAGLRVGGALGATSARVTWEEGRTPGREHVVDLLQALVDGLACGLDDATTRQRLFALAGNGAPRVMREEAPPEQDLPVPAELQAWIQTLDGRRPLSEALEFGPLDAALGLRTLYLATLLGIVGFPGASGSEVRAERVPAVTPEPGDEADARLVRLIASGLSRTTREALPPMDPAEAIVRSEIHRIEQATTHHEVLGMPWNSQPDDFQKAYFAIARILHPDRMTASEADLVTRASTAFDRAREAWECFRDEASRQAYLDRVVHGKKTEEEQVLERVQEILSMEALFRRGMAFFHAGQVVKAFPCFEEAARKVPEQAEFQIYLGYTLWRLKRGQDAEEAARGRRMLEEALEQGGRDDGFVLLGRVCREEGDEEGATRAWTRVLKVNPENREALREVERIRQARASDTRTPLLRRLLSHLFGPGKGQ